MPSELPWPFRDPRNGPRTREEPLEARESHVGTYRRAAVKVVGMQSVSRALRTLAKTALQKLSRGSRRFRLFHAEPNQSLRRRRWLRHWRRALRQDWIDLPAPQPA